MHYFYRLLTLTVNVTMCFFYFHQVKTVQNYFIMLCIIITVQLAGCYSVIASSTEQAHTENTLLIEPSDESH